MDTDRLKFIMLGLERGMPLSSVMLFTLQFFRPWLDESAVRWLNRELLGYLPEEAARMTYRLDSFSQEDLDSISDLDLPSYRTVSGNWLSWRQTAGIASVTAGTLWCCRGVVEIEEFLQTGAEEIVLEREESGYAFMSNSANLQLVLDAVRNHLKEVLWRLLTTMQTRDRDGYVA